jgi:hypothetical protein
MRKFLLTLLVACIGSAVSAQPYNNEWIDYGKTYYRFKVGATGLYRIGQPILAGAGLGATQAQHFKLFRNGQEVPLFTSVATGVLGTNDFIEFYGEMNDGKAEKQLYKTDDLQMSDRWSLLTDTASYFLTVQTTGSNLRMVNTANNVAGTLLTPETHFMHKLNRYFKNRLNKGYGIDFGDLVHSSSYEKGEGWTTEDINPGVPLTENHGNLYVYTPGPTATLATVCAGNYTSSRNITVRLNGTDVATNFVSGFDITRTNTTGIATTSFTGDAAAIQFVNGGGSGDRIVVSGYELTYPRQFNFGNAARFDFELTAGGGSRYLVINNFNYGSTPPILYDMTNRLRLTGDLNAGTVRYVLPPSATARSLVLFNVEAGQVNNVTALAQRNFVNYATAANQGDYIIISHPLLFNDGAGNNPVEQYRQYRSSAPGGSYNAKTVAIDQLIDQFGFGVRGNPLAIRNFASFALNSFAVQPKLFFLIGKGLTYNEYRAYESFPNTAGLDMIPTFGFPASDNLLTASRTGVTSRISIGRLSAISGLEVAQYLAKVQQYEQAQVSLPQTIPGRGWMKNVAQITGAIDDGSLYGLITAYMQGYEQVISDTAFGGKVYSFSKNIGQTALGTNKIVDTLFTEGISLLTYFGHSSPNTLEFNLDNPQNYSNTGKYPLIIVNGCNTGNLFLFDTLRPVSKGTLSEKYVFANQKGSIGFIASTHFGLPQQLNYVTLAFYRNLADYKYGGTVGDIMKATMEQVSTNYAFDFIARTHCEEITYHGDPAIRLNPSNKPDYTITNDLISFNPSVISVADDKVVINAKIVNIGKAITDSITVRFQHKLPNNSVVTIASRRIKATLYEDTLQVSLPLNPLSDKGLNQVIVTIDPDGAVDEMSESNNTVTKDFTIIEDEIRPVYPYNYSLANKNNLVLYGSTANPTVGMRQYVMELDTTRLFNSPFKVTRTINSTGGLIRFSPGVALTDSVVYHWRLAVGPVNGSTRWLESSFIPFTGNVSGYGQGNYFQYTDNAFTGLSINALSRQFEFAPQTRKLLVRAGVFPFYSWDRNNMNLDANQLDFWGCVFNNLQFYVFDSLTHQPWQNVNVGANGRFGSWTVCPPAPGLPAIRSFFEFPFTDPVYRKRAMDFFDSIPSGMYVAVRPLMASSNTTFINQWMADTATLGSGKSLWHKFKQMGFSQIDSFTSNRQFLFVFKKQGNGATQIRQSVNATVNEHIVDTFQLSGRDILGNVSTPWLGPVKAWKNFKWDKRGAADSVGNRSFDIIGKDMFGNEVTLVTVTKVVDTVIDFIDANTYPYLKLRMNNEDASYAQATQLKYWYLTADMYPEGAVAPNVQFQYRDTLAPTDTLKLKVAFKNITNIAFDSLKLRLTIKDNYGDEQVLNANGASATYRIAPLPGTDSVIISYNIPMARYSGKNALFLDVNPDNDQLEQYHFNNVLFRNFWVVTQPCPGTTISYNSGYRGSYTYQWQVNTGSGYTNLVNDAVHQNVNGDSVRLVSPPTSWYGAKYRCFVTDGTNSYYSDEYILKFGMRWTGNVNTDWQNAGNWSCGTVPDQYTDVTIAAGAPRYPLVNLNVTCRSLSLTAGAVVNVQAGSGITIAGK